ncbi:hypothetical protein J3R30DRAFT_3514019 [Lentinula aciculospora]|uniref:Uncharacterized protein n=1 Tax=Lentinula aciculospora TaxID=153920 RepID=A0A9W9A356_9AGAR|nr:hypothetical protein J3R30DRAFT_3514019 [Lentinula aciculospora]
METQIARTPTHIKRRTLHPVLIAVLFSTLFMAANAFPVPLDSRSYTLVHKIFVSGYKVPYEYDCLICVCFKLSTNTKICRTSNLNPAEEN